AILVDPVDPQIIYTGTWGRGVFKSVNGAMDWLEITADLLHQVVVSLGIDPRDPNTIYAGTNGSGVHKSTDGGATWFATGLTYPFIFGSLLVDPRDSNTVFAGTNGGIYKSTNGGQTWALTSPGITLTRHLAMHPSDSNILYATKSTGSVLGGVYKSIDAGET